MSQDCVTFCPGGPHEGASLAVYIDAVFELVAHEESDNSTNLGAAVILP